jgi:hypothetical protein
MENGEVADAFDWQAATSLLNPSRVQRKPRYSPDADPVFNVHRRASKGRQFENIGCAPVAIRRVTGANRDGRELA